MKPILFHAGPFPIYAFGVLVAAGILLSLYLMSKAAKRTGFPPAELAMDMVFVIVVSGFVGARLYYIFENFSWYRQNPLKIFAIWEGGLTFYGGFLTAFVGLWLFLKSKKISVWRGLDFLIPYVALTHGFGRLGCFMNGCCFGKVCELPWAVHFPGHAAGVHPTQLYEAFFNFFLFAWLAWRYERKLNGTRYKRDRFGEPVPFVPGTISALYFIVYGAGRFFVEFFREGNPFWGPLTINQWMSGGVLIFGLWLYFRKPACVVK